MRSCNRLHRGRDIGSLVVEAQQKITERVVLPTGYRVTWGGSFENMERAMAKLQVIVPITIGLIFFLLYSTFNSLRQATLIILNLPFALIGGVVALWLTKEYLSVPASVVFINLFGVSVLNGIVLVSYMNKLREDGHSLEEAVTSGALLRLRPVLMTALVALLGLVPLAFANGIGSEVQRPLAIVVIGGLVSSTLLTLIMLPVLYQWLEGRSTGEIAPSELRGGSAPAVHSAATEAREKMKDEVRRMPTLAGTVCMGLVAIIVGVQVSIAAPKEPESKSANVAKGEKVFVRHCAGCHGSEGKGDGYLLLGPEPANLTRPTTKKKSDAILLQTIHEGKPNMPSWKTRLSEEDSRAVLAYVRTLVK